MFHCMMTHQSVDICAPAIPLLGIVCETCSHLSRSESFRIQLLLIFAPARLDMAEAIRGILAICTPDVSLETRVGMVSPVINSMIAEYEASVGAEGVQTFQQRLVDLLRESELSYQRWVDVDKVGVHPHNRESTGILPVDVHDLLLHIGGQGWSWEECSGAFGSEIPPTPMGEAWRAWNLELVRASDGLLAPIRPDILEVLTVRASHTTAAVRCVKLGCKGMHPIMCSTDGSVNYNKIMEWSPSLREPCEKGMKYTVLRWQILEACPRLMEMLSRTGNASHGSAREQTVLQACKRIHALSAARTTADGKPDWVSIIKLAAVGLPPGYEEKAKCFQQFVVKWSGGKQGQVLTELVAFERQLRVKRTIVPEDLKTLAGLNLSHAPRYVVAMVKAMLTAPTAFVHHGFAVLFSSSDYSSLESGGKNSQQVVDVQTLLSQAHDFILAYSTLPLCVNSKLLADCEVRCIMYVHGKRATTRQHFDSLPHIAAQLHSEVSAAMVKANGGQLPTWSILESMKPSVQPSGSSGQSLVREVDLRGSISDSDLLGAGFKMGSVVYQRKDDDIHHIIQSFDGQIVKLVLRSDEETTTEVKRSELLAAWVCKATETSQEFNCEDFATRSHFDFVVEAWKGRVRAALHQMFASSPDKGLKIVKTTKTVVVATKSFNEGELKLVPFTNSVSSMIDKDGKAPTAPSGVSLGSLFQHKGEHVRFFLKPALHLPDVTIKLNKDSTLPIAFWAAFTKQTPDPDAANSGWETRRVTIHVASELGSKASVEIDIPIIVNQKPINIGDEIVCLKRKDAPADPDVTEPPAKKGKKGKVAQGKSGKGKGK